MPVMLERWNDDKMDAMSGKVAALGANVAVLDAKVDALDAKVDALDTKVDGLAGELSEQRREMNSRFDAMQCTMILAMVAMPGAFAIMVRLIT